MDPLSFKYLKNQISSIYKKNPKKFDFWPFFLFHNQYQYYFVRLVQKTWSARKINFYAQSRTWFNWE